MKKFIYSLLILLFIVLISNLAIAQDDSKFVLFILDGVSINEIQEVTTPNLDEVIAKGAVGLMNVKTAGGLEPKDAYLTIGSGDRARAGRAGYLNFNVGVDYQETAVEDIYSRRIDKFPIGDIVNLQLTKVKATNRTSDYQAQVGYLANSLQEADLQVTVLGNADVKGQPRRQIALIGINKYGVVKQGDVGQQMYRQADQHPSGYITNQSYLMKQFRSFWRQSDLLVIESGDTSRIEAVDHLLTDKKFKETKRSAINRADKLLGQILEEIDLATDYLLVVTPTPAKKARRRGNKLTLATLVGPQVKNGLLTSATTRRLGLVTNLDIAPTIYQALTSSVPDFTGRSISSVTSNQSLSYLTKLNRMIRRTFAWRPIVVKGFILLQIITLVLVGVSWIYKLQNSLLEKIITYLLISLLWIPSLFLLSSLFIELSIELTIIIWLGVSLLLAHYTLQLDNELIPFLVPALVTAGLLVVDLWQGGKWIKLSVLGYSPVIGARFYGIGNEFMGIIIGAGIIGLTGLQELNFKLFNRYLLLFFLLLVGTVGYPKLGANFGGLITATIVVTATYFYLQGYELNWQILLKIGLIVSLVVLIVVIVDLSSGLKTETHLAHTLSSIKEEGISKLFLIIYRKLQMNLKLLRWTIWSRVLLAFVIILVILFKWPQGRIRSLVNNYSKLTAGFRGLIVGSIVTMLVNDSGVVAAATLLLFPIFTLLYLVINCEFN
ncbi:hypothetical protein JCM16358_10300 [Halanaerocella petrolearia]